jgi:hypothetical protein
MPNGVWGTFLGRKVGKQQKKQDPEGKSIDVRVPQEEGE